MTNIIIRHTAGAKANQVEQFPVDAATLHIGRDPACEIALDPTQDTAVSRRHAAITVTTADPLTIEINDLGSRNGTFVNGEQISGATELSPSSEIQLGKGGPVFTFDLDPCPAHLAAHLAAPATQILDLGMKTEIMDVAGADAAAPKSGVGAETVQRMLSVERKSSSRKLALGLGTAAMAILMVGGGLLVSGQSQAAETRGAIENANQVIAEAGREIRSVSDRVGLSAEQIEQQFRDTNVMIHAGWRLTDPISNATVYQQTLKYENEGFVHNLPVFKIEGGELVRVLTLSSESGFNPAIAEGQLQGSGFVVSENGFILTNKHVAASWNIPYSSDLAGYTAGIIIDDKGEMQVESMDALLSMAPSIMEWRPSDGGYLFDTSGDVPRNLGWRDFEGQADQLKVQFPGTAISFEAELVRVSAAADVAMLKVDVPTRLKAVTLADPKAEPARGSRAYVMGYPDVSERYSALMETTEVGRRYSYEQIADPTITVGNVSNIAKGRREFEAEPGTVHYTENVLGYIYEIAVPGTGSGNSGGPVFNDQGEVIGIYTYGRETATGASTSFAVPITFGVSLLGPRRIVD
ncbi:MAG: trypsin-like peptidase domain-containing protein [Pseudomonadota bacterium]